MNSEQISSFITSSHLIGWDELCVTEDIRAWFASSPDISKEIFTNELKVSAYTFQYHSRGHLVQGFYAGPKRDFSEKMPCIIFNRGGTGDFGKLKVGHFFMGIIPKLVQSGYLVFASQYSGSGLSEGEDGFGGDDVYDVLELYRLIRNHPLADNRRIGMYGESRGGMMTYLSLVKSDWIRAAVSIAGMADLISAENFRPGTKEHFEKVFGGSILEKKNRSALYWSERFPKETPILLMHGTADWRVDSLDSLRLAGELQKLRVPYRLIMFEGADHQLNEYRDEADWQTISWFDRFVRDGNRIPVLEPHGK